MPKKAAPRLQLEQAGAMVRANLLPTMDTPTYYANMVEVSHTQHDFCMGVVRIPGKLTADQLREVQEKQTLTLEPMLQLLLPPTVIPKLIEALQTQLVAFQGTQQEVEKAERREDKK